MNVKKTANIKVTKKNLSDLLRSFLSIKKKETNVSRIWTKK